jgi:hypothetical protein
MNDANRQIERKSTLAEQGKEDDLRNTTIEERWNMMWQLAVDAWAMKGVDVTMLPMRKDFERLCKLQDRTQEGGDETGSF